MLLPFTYFVGFNIHYENMKLKSPTTVKNHWNRTEKIYERYSHWNCLLLLSKNVNPLWYHWKFSTLLISFVLLIFIVTLVFQCDFQCHILEVKWLNMCVISNIAKLVFCLTWSVYLYIRRNGKSWWTKCKPRLSLLQKYNTNTTRIALTLACPWTPLIKQTQVHLRTFAEYNLDNVLWCDERKRFWRKCTCSAHVMYIIRKWCVLIWPWCCLRGFSKKYKFWERNAVAPWEKSLLFLGHRLIDLGRKCGHVVMRLMTALKTASTFLSCS